MEKHFLVLFVILSTLLLNRSVFSEEFSEQSSGIVTRSTSSRIEYSLIQENFGVEEEPGVIHPEYRPSDLVEKTSFPDRYDARDYGYITGVKDQKPYDLCWSESVMSMAESNMIKKGLAENDIDLSEIYPHYFQWHRVPDPLGLTAGDENRWYAYESYPGYIREWINSWGSGYRAVLLLSSGFGTAKESTAPYPDADTDIPNYSLDPELAWKSDVVRLKNAYWISMNDTEAVKRMIMKYGSVVVAFNQKASDYLNKENGAYYCPDPLYTNHLVNVIGWDNNYPAANFLSDPGISGAWLFKNSFGDDWGDQGYGWLSYNDKTISADAFVFDFDAINAGESIYQYDGSVSYDYITDPESYSVAAANVFTAFENERISSVSFITPSSYFSYEIKIYRGVKDSPESGILFSSQKGTELYAGFHTIELETPVDLVSGDRFSVVVEITADRKGGAYIMTDRSVSYALNLPDGSSKVYQEMISFSNPGESFYRTGSGEWQDCWNNDPELSLGNVRIKANTEFQSFSSISKGDETENSSSQYELYRMSTPAPARVPNF